MSGELIAISTVKLVGAVVAIISTVLGGNAWVTKQIATEVVTEKLIEHKRQPHTSAASLDEMTVISSRVDVQDRTINDIRVMQSGFSSDINWIKNSLQRIEDHID